MTKKTKRAPRRNEDPNRQDEPRTRSIEWHVNRFVRTFFHTPHFPVNVLKTMRTFPPGVMWRTVEMLRTRLLQRWSLAHMRTLLNLSRLRSSYMRVNNVRVCADYLKRERKRDRRQMKKLVLDKEEMSRRRRGHKYD